MTEVRALLHRIPLAYLHTTFIQIMIYLVVQHMITRKFALNGLIGFLRNCGYECSWSRTWYACLHTICEASSFKTKHTNEQGPQLDSFC